MRWKFSHLKNSRAPAMVSAVLEVSTGVRWAAPSMRAAACSTSLYWSGVSVPVMSVSPRFGSSKGDSIASDASGGEGEGELEHQAAAFAVADLQFGVVAGDDALDDRQAEAGAVGLAA